MGEQAAAAPVPWLRRAPGQVLLGVVVVGALLGLERLLDVLTDREIITGYHLLIGRYIGINIVMAASLNLVNGVTGQFSIGHAGFMAVGAYTSAAITMAARSAWPDAPALLTAVFVASLVAGGVVAAGSGYLVGLPSLRLRGDYLAIVTLGFGEIIRVVILNVNALGGARGLYGITGHASVFWVALVVVITVVTLHRIARSDYGRTLLAIREDEVAAEAMGVATTRRKVEAFAVAAFFAGIAGGLFAHTVAYLNPNSFTFVKSFDYVVMVILGGMGSLSGAILAATLLTLLLEVLRPTTLSGYLEAAHLDGMAQWVQGHDLRISLYAFILIAMMLLRPNGFLGKREIWEAWPFRRRGAASAAA